MQQAFLKKIHLNNFRNLYLGRPAELSSGLNIVFGDNGQGKTNFLEAIYFTSQKKSFKKNTTFKELINFASDKHYFELSLGLEDPLLSGMEIYSGRIEKGKQTWRFNNSLAGGKSPFPVMIVRPYDFYQFCYDASFRRHWFDLALSLFDTEYRLRLKEYRKSIRLRNALLSGGSRNNSLLFIKKQLDAFDENFAKLAYYLTKSRQEFLRDISSYFADAANRFFYKKVSFEISYLARFEDLSIDQIRNIYRSNFDKDMAIRRTSSGVHLDDYQIFLNGMDARLFASTGQQRVCFLSSVVGFCNFYQSKFKKTPLLLVDDITAELDQKHWHNLVSYFLEMKGQIIISGAGQELSGIFRPFQVGQKILIENGNLEQ